MKVLRARTAGFCMGVSLALRKLRQAINEHDARQGRIAMWGPIIHNPQVLAEFEAQGVCRLSRLEEVQPGDMVLIRAHGIPLAEEEALRRKGAVMLDATCPKVKKAQLAIAGATCHGEPLLLFGEAEHPEVRGLLSYAAGPYRVFASLGELPSIASGTTSGVVLAAQTTQDLAGFAVATEALRRHIPNLRVLSTICEATSKRQKEVMDIARQVDMMIVAGGRQSGNTRRLVDVAQAEGVPTLHVETLAELAATDKLRKDAIVGLTAGASTPPALVDAMQHFLECLE